MVRTLYRASSSSADTSSTDANQTVVKNQNPDRIFPWIIGGGLAFVALIYLEGILNNPSK